MSETRVFFRDDDVGEMTPPLRFVLDTLIEASIPCHYQVVPSYLDSAAAGELRRLQRAHPGLVILNQHGLRHEQQIDGRRQPTEFAGGRPFADQLHDIRQGREMLASALGDAFSPDVFTPPCHKFDANTLRALGDLGFDTVSAGVHTDWRARLYYALGRRARRISLFGRRVSYHLGTTPDPRIREVSVAIDVHEAVDREGRRLEKSAEDLWQEFVRLRRPLDVVGIMLHHQACDSRAREQALSGFVDRLRGDPGVRFVTIPEILAEEGISVPAPAPETAVP